MNPTVTEEQSLESIGFVFIHGAGLNSGIWKTVANQLEYPYLLVDFPQRQSPKAMRHHLTLHDYTTHIQKQIEAWKVKKFVIVAHSLGGIPALQIASAMQDRLAGFAAVGAAIPANGGSFLSIMPPAKRAMMHVLLRVFGTQPPESAIRSGLCNDLTAEQTEEIVRGFAPESIRVYTDRTEAPIPNAPKLYVKLTNDREFGLPQQDRIISHLAPDHVELLDAGHLPMLSKPNELHRALTDFLARI
ncbi:alpha/beta fold hydrolase [Paenibacillus allorhizosphaerae]|uniref:AB hydrolase-1 domain-containing protein n=1 Tax=Paenibacillus allorhizosphaerae TaxID=2849866 RepID=A0ABM8VKD7_9BACL|nr:alpha/beta hydrolase [Paenibacillus allorhizosphaerae]CAG7646850.1 hypothetical protein PAECIP111802_03847 [Paenibacillus allorhizosphaerae]